MIDVRSLQRELSEAFGKAAQRGGRHPGSGPRTLASVTWRIPDLDPLHCFRRGHALGRRFYWHPADGPAIAGLGSIADLPAAAGNPRAGGSLWQELLADAVIVGPDLGLEPACRPGTGPLLTGCLPFDPVRPRSNLWGAFPLHRLAVPRFTITSGPDGTWLTVNAFPEPGADVQPEVERLQAQIAHLLTGPEEESGRRLLPCGATRARVTEGDGEHFCRLVERAVDAIRRGEMEKVVAARSIEVRGTWSVSDVLQRLRHNQPGCTIFAVTGRDASFVGATPEWLVRLGNGEARISCLAGTAPRGSTPEEDRALGEALLASDKERREHALVLEMLRERLAGVVADLHVPPAPVVMRLPGLQHLSTPITAVVTGYDLLSLVERLHPSPAVAGLPRDRALAFLRTYEGLDRGAYAGPVGWTDRFGEGEFAVGIRSALLRGDEATVFAGCGIVAASEPRREEAESLLKMRPMLAALGAGRAA